MSVRSTLFTKEITYPARRKQNWLGIVALDVLLGGWCNEVPDRVPEYVRRDRALCEIELTGTVSSASCEAVAHRRETTLNLKLKIIGN